MNKSYSIQGQEFSMIGNDLELLNKAAPLIARLRKLSYEYTKDLDMTQVNSYRARIGELVSAKSQLNDMLESGIDENENPLTEEKKAEITERIKGLEVKIDGVSADFATDTVAQNLVRLKEELESYALIELLTDIIFLKPILKKILKGGNIDKVDFTDAIGFVRDVVTDFFGVMNNNSLK